MIGFSKRPGRGAIALVLAAIAWLAPGPASATGRATDIDMLHAMSVAGFGPGFAPDITLTPLGTAKVGRSCYRVVYFVWEETSEESHGDALHAAYRVLLFSCAGGYLGDYGVAGDSGVPHLEGTTVVFPHGPDSPIALDASGRSPGSYIGGDQPQLDPAGFHPPGDAWSYGDVARFLGQGGFTGRLDGKTLLWWAGDARPAGECFRVINYERAPNGYGKPGSDRRVLLFTCKGQYLGFYGPVRMLPFNVYDDEIDFPCHQTCDRDGGDTIGIVRKGLPEVVSLYGRHVLLTK